MNYVKMATGADISNFISLELEAVTTGIFDDDTEKFYPGVNAGYKAHMELYILPPVMLSGGTVIDSLDGNMVVAMLNVTDPEGNVKTYIPANSDGQIVWAAQS